MTHGRWLWALVLTLALGLFGAGTAHAQTGVKVLVLKGSTNATDTAGYNAIKALGDANDFTVEQAAGVTDITASKLEGYQALVFLNVGGDVLDSGGEAALQGFVEDGKGFLGIGSTATVEPGSSFVNGLIGARPNNNPTTPSSQAVIPGDRVHPSTRSLPLRWERSDLWYTWTTRPTGTVHTVARYRGLNAAAGDGTNVGGTDHPISWCRDYSGGRSFYTGMGRVEGAYAEADFRTHLLGALRWTAGLVRGDCKATINANYRGTKIVSAGPTLSGLATSGESHGLSVADNGWVFYIGRGDCRTDAERGGLLGLPTIGRILDHANANVGIGCGSVHIFDPAQATGAENSGVTRAGTLAVYGDGGQGGERTNEDNHKMEYGLLGVVADPDFSENGYIYLQYFPTFNEQTLPPGLPASRRISKMSEPRVSRFKVNLQTKQLDLRSEQIIFKYDAQIFSCCHVGGGMGFDSEGNLYVTTGDTNSSQGTGGYSGNNPTAKCPIGPNDVASSAHCGTANYSYQDARRTAGNTNDYNGKMLRFRPLDEIAAGATPGVGRTYALPTASSPNGPNLFKGDEKRDAADTETRAKPEIFAMGLRNPSRLSIDPKDDTVYTAWVGPDASSPSVTDGPSTYENAAQISRAANYGWPYCMGSKQAYRDRIASGAQRTDSPEGYVPGGPATGGTEGWYDCDNLRNDSPNNTGLVVLPHQTGTGMDAGKVRGNNLWWSRGNQNNANGCPEFPRQRTAPAGRLAAPNYGAAPTQGCPYVNDQGLTVMNGPLYRYENGTDNSRRWPQYWDGRWFLHNNGGASVKHGLLLDPATDQDAGLPVYADSLRNALSWQGSYMDSKFGPDGALYVQTYDGFFRAGPNVSIYRYDYTGGAPTPGANPRAFAIGANRVRFSSAGSGGVAWEWDFGDGTAKSNEANPTHTYAEAKRYTATLTVTYADGAKDSKSVDVDVLAQADESAPVTTAALNPAQPGNGGTYQRAVTVTLSATDQGSGVDTTEYRIKVDNGSFGDWQDYDAPIRREQPGTYTIEYRSTDRTGNVEPAKTVSFTIAVADNCETDFNDEFNGTALDPKWTVLRPLPEAMSFVNGAMRIKVRDGDMIGGDADARNVLLQDAPSGSWQIQTKLDVSTLTNSGEQAGFVLWQSEGPNTFAKITYISKDTFSQYEWVATRNGQSQISAGPQISTPDGDVWLRVSHNGSGTYIAEGSVNGEDWIKIAGDITNLGNPETLKFGLKVSDTADSENYAAFDWFRVDCSDKVAPITTGELSDEPDGELGWYQTAPEITLTADDGIGEVARTEYRVLDPSKSDEDNAKVEWTAYTAPFTISAPGEHIVEYRSVDASENVEAAKRLAFRVDGSAPVPQPTVEGDLENGPVKVTLDTGDGDKGSGTVLTQYRVDGGPWQVYEAKDDEVIFDGSEASLQQWKQAPDGRFDYLTDPDTGEGYISPVGGLGMLWYPAKQYGDFKFKFQFREGRTDGGFSNGGAFVRFPNPEETPRVHECSKAGSAATSAAWVAINCGHEIQLYDGETGETRKTGSIYTFDNNNLAQSGFKVANYGKWEDYEIEVVGQHYTISRNGEVINEFDNTPGKNSDRAGDPSTTLRQFTEGYLGLQNHGGADTMQYRRMRVEDLTPGAPKAADGTGPFEVSGRGPHTIEVRAVDAAGNESSQPYEFEIGDTLAPPAVSDPGQTVVVPLPPVATLPPMIDTPASFRLGTISSRITRATFARRGLKVPVACTGAMDGSAKLTVSSATRKRLKLKSATLGRTDVRCWGPHTATVSFKPSSAIAKLLARKGGPARVKMTVAVQMRDWGKPATTLRKSVTLKRR